MPDWFMYLLAVIFALFGLWALVRYLTLQNWLSEDEAAEAYARVRREAARQQAQAHDFSKPAPKGINRTHVHRMPPSNGAA